MEIRIERRRDVGSAIIGLSVLGASACTEAYAQTASDTGANRAPVTTTLAPEEIRVPQNDTDGHDSLVTVTGWFSDPDGDPLVYHLHALEADTEVRWLEIYETEGVIRVHEDLAHNERLGKHTVTVVAEDPSHARLEHEVVINLTSGNLPPKLRTYTNSDGDEVEQEPRFIIEERAGVPANEAFDFSFSQNDIDNLFRDPDAEGYERILLDGVSGDLSIGQSFFDDYDIPSLHYLFHRTEVSFTLAAAFGEDFNKLAVTMTISDGETPFPSAAAFEATFYLSRHEEGEIDAFAFLDSNDHASASGRAPTHYVLPKNAGAGFSDLFELERDEYNSNSFNIQFLPMEATLENSGRHDVTITFDRDPAYVRPSWETGPILPLTVEEVFSFFLINPTE